MNILLPLTITLAVETIVYMLFFKWDKRIFVIASVLNLILNPAMNFSLSLISDPLIYWISLSIAEVATIFIESLVIYLFKKEKYPRILLICLIANFASLLIGLSLFKVYEMRITPIIICVAFFLVYIFAFIYTFFLRKTN